MRISFQIKKLLFIFNNLVIIIIYIFYNVKLLLELIFHRLLKKILRLINQNKLTAKVSFVERSKFFINHNYTLLKHVGVPKNRLHATISLSDYFLLRYFFFYFCCCFLEYQNKKKISH